jgi:hypothetical protein
LHPSDLPSDSTKKKGSGTFWTFIGFGQTAPIVHQKQSNSSSLMTLKLKGQLAPLG